jgi:hypothetical protein
MVVSAGCAGRWGRPWAAVLAAASLAWLLVNKEMEGSILLTVSATHSLVAADLAGLAGLALAVLILVFW